MSRVNPQPKELNDLQYSSFYVNGVTVPQFAQNYFGQSCNRQEALKELVMSNSSVAAKLLAKRHDKLTYGLKKMQYIL